MGGALVEPRENTAGWVGGVKRIMGCFYVFLVICLLQRMGGFVIVCVFVSVGKIKGLVGGLCKPVDLDVAGCWVVFAVVPLYPTWKKNTLVFEQSCLTSALSVPAHTLKSSIVVMPVFEYLCPASSTRSADMPEVILRMHSTETDEPVLPSGEDSLKDCNPKSFILNDY